MARSRSDEGYVLALVSVALIPLLVVSALAVDVAVWQAKGATLQRVADAAALAGVSGLPDESEMVSRGLTTAGLNDGGADLEVAMSRLSPSLVEATVTDRSGGGGLSVPFLSPPVLTRRAVAEFVAPVALGSPRNFLGTAGLARSDDPYTGLPGVPDTAAEDFWLAVSGPCAGREHGDWLLPQSMANYDSANPPTGDRRWRGCLPSADPSVRLSPSHDPSGYRVVAEVPSTYSGGPFTLQIYDAPRCVTSPGDGGDDTGPFNTRIVVRERDLVVSDDQPAAVLVDRLFPSGWFCSDSAVLPAGYECGAGSWARRWCNLATITNPVPGARYTVEISTTGASPTAQHTRNAFSLRARSGARSSLGAFTPCSTDPYDPAIGHDVNRCVQIYAEEWMGVFVGGVGSQPAFYLAGVGPEHAGGVMEVSLFDIGEGSVSLQVLDPLGRAVGFSWAVDQVAGDLPPTGGFTGRVSAGGSLDTRGLTTGDACGGGNLQAGNGRYSSSKYNDRMVRLTIPLPADLDAAYLGRSWWRVRYGTCAGRTVSDRTTWGVRIGGQPVRLVR